MRRRPKKNKPPGATPAALVGPWREKPSSCIAVAPFATISLAMKLIRRKPCGRLDTPAYFFNGRFQVWDDEIAPRHSRPQVSPGNDHPPLRHIFPTPSRASGQ